MEAAICGVGRARGRSRGRARPEPRPGLGNIAMQLQHLSLEIPESNETGGAGCGQASGWRPRNEMSTLVTRPAHVTDKTGTMGRPIRLVANFFRLLSSPEFCVHQYHLDFVPNVESRTMRRAMVSEHRDLFGQCYVFDGMFDLKTPRRLEQEMTLLWSQRRSDGAQICIRVKRVQALAPFHPDLLRLFNTQMRRNLAHLGFVQINRHFYDAQAVTAIPQHNLELWQGLLTAIGQHETGLMMVADTVHKVLQCDTVLDLLMHISARSPRGSRQYRDEAIQRVAGAIVLTRYNNRTYRVDDIDWTQSPRCSFDTKEGPKTYVDYYRVHYETLIRDPTQPLLVCRPSEKYMRGRPLAGCTPLIYLVPELCVLTGLTDKMRADVAIMRDLAVHTRLEPPRRVGNLLDLVTRLNSDSNVTREMSQWGLQLDNSLVGIDARVMPPEVVTQGTQNFRYAANRADFSREMRDKRMHLAVTLDSWVVICPTRDMRTCADFVRTLMSVCPPMGVRVSEPRFLELEDDRAGSYVRALQQLHDSQMVLAILPNDRKDRYDMIKRHACIELGLQTQMLLTRTIGNQKNVRSVATRVAIQLNCKLGGEAWCLEIPLKQTMVIGYNTYRDSGQSGCVAGAFVASLNQTFTRWFSRASFHTNHQELGTKLVLHLHEALQQYASDNGGAMPERLVFYRDGVSDGQIPQVRELEVDQILTLLDTLFPGKEHKMAFVVVSKRISTRFFVETSGVFANPPPGTVVDSEVTRPEKYDFFLVSQSVRQGTVTPTHYNVIHDSTGLKPDHMQRLSYKLTHLYFNWPGTIRVPAPCQYAYKLAFLVGQSLHKEPHRLLNNTLFYL